MRIAQAKIDHRALNLGRKKPQTEKDFQRNGSICQHAKTRFMNGKSKPTDQELITWLLYCGYIQ